MLDVEVSCLVLVVCTSSIQQELNVNLVRTGIEANKLIV